VSADIKRKVGSFAIGVTTVYLVVCFITSLESLAAVAPLALLKVGQDSSGAFDMSLTPDYPDIV